MSIKLMRIFIGTVAAWVLVLARTDWHSTAGTYHHKLDGQATAAVLLREQSSRQEQYSCTHSHTNSSSPPCFSVRLLLRTCKCGAT